MICSCGGSIMLPLPGVGRVAPVSCPVDAAVTAAAATITTTHAREVPIGYDRTGRCRARRRGTSAHITASATRKPLALVFELHEQA